MSQKITALIGPFIPLVEAVAGALDGKEDQLLSINNVGKAVLFDGTLPAVAVMVDKLAPGDTAIRARLIHGGGTVRMMQDAAIVPGSRVAGKTGTSRVETAGAGSRSLGIKIYPPTNGAQGDVIEVIDLPENPRIATQVADLGALTSTDGTATAAADLAALKAETEKVGDDVRMVHAKLVAVIAALKAQIVFKD